MRALGIDVSVRRGLDVVLLDDHLQVLEVASRVALTDVLPLARRLKPEIVCIDSPASWARTGRSRSSERQMARMGIAAYATPVDPGDHPFYRWMRVGFSVYSELSGDYPLLRDVTKMIGRAAEVFPHASAVILAGRLPGGEPKLRFRTAVLRDHGVDVSALRTQDQVDAALGALTGLKALAGDFTAIGEPEDGLLLLPSRTLPVRLAAGSLDQSAPTTALAVGRIAPDG